MGVSVLPQNERRQLLASATQLTAIGAIAFPLLHSVTDVWELVQGGFSKPQLWANYAAFLPMPAVLLGLLLPQAGRISVIGLWGALLYGFSFVYFAHSTLDALALDTATYSDLWEKLGTTYTIHGAVMIAGGAMFGFATYWARVFPRWTASLFLIGVALNLVVAILPVPRLEP